MRRLVLRGRAQSVLQFANDVGSGSRAPLTVHAWIPVMEPRKWPHNALVNIEQQAGLHKSESFTHYDSASILFTISRSSTLNVATSAVIRLM